MMQISAANAGGFTQTLMNDSPADECLYAAG